MINPSVGYADYCTNADPAFRNALACTLKQDFADGENTCLALNPQYCCGNSWFYYYERLLRPTLRQYAETQRVNYGQALVNLSRRLAILELVPYYSANARQITKPFLSRLTSAQKAQEAGRDLHQRATGHVKSEHRNGLEKEGKAAILERLKVQVNSADPIVIVRWRHALWGLAQSQQSH